MSGLFCCYCSGEILAISRLTSSSQSFKAGDTLGMPVSCLGTLKLNWRQWVCLFLSQAIHNVALGYASAVMHHCYFNSLVICQPMGLHFCGVPSM